MTDSVVPMIHVPDVRAAAEWYGAIGFTIVDTNEEGGHLDWAMLAFGSSAIMLNEGGRPSPDHRREVDLYIHTNRLEELHARVSGIAEIVEDIHDTFYGMQEFTVRDLNRFWITFGRPSGSA